MADTNSLPSTEPHHAPIFDTGPHPDPLQPLSLAGLVDFDTDAFMPPVTWHAEPVLVRPHPVAVPESDLHLKRWPFVFIVAAVWILAAAAGLGFYFWWYTSMHKTAPVFAVLIYLIVCTIGSLLASLVQNKPQVTALAIALMSAPLASMATAAVLHGAYYFEWIARPAIG